MAGLQIGEKPLRNACSNWAPVSVSITVRLPKGSTANISPQVISPGCSPALGGATVEVGAQAARVGVGRIHARVLQAHGVGHHIAHRGLEETGRGAHDVDRLRADDLVAQHGGLRVGVVDDGLHIRPLGHAQVLRDAGRRAGPFHVLPLTISCTTE